MRLKLIFVLLPVLFNLQGTSQTPKIIYNESAIVEQNLSVFKNKFENYLTTVSAFGFSGAVLIAKGDSILIKRGYGWADEKNKIPITEKTFFDIGSFVKAFTATAIMQLEERGKLKVTDTITKFFQNVPTDKSNITIHNLLTHTSGLIYDDFYDQISQASRDSIKDRNLYIHRLLGFALGYETGKGRSYSNTGFALLAAIIEIVSGKSYEEYVHTNLFEPAGMKETGYFIPTNLKRVSHGYNDGPTDYGFPWTTQWEGNRPLWDLMGNGGMLSTLDDMYKWAVAIKDDKLVSHKTKDKMFTRYYTAANQAYGWNRAEDPKTKAIYITRYGDAVPQAWNMEYRWYIEQELIFIVLTNKRIRAGSIRRPVMTKLTDIALHNSEAPLFAYKLTGTKETLSKYAGIYKMPSGSLFKVHLNEIPISQNKQISQLLISAQGQDAVDLLYSGNTLKEIAALLKTLNKKTESYISALQNRNKDSLQIFFSGDTIQTALLMWNETENRFGKLKDYTILGTSPLNQSGSQTFIKLYFEKGSGVYKVTWKQGRIWDQDEDRLQPMITTFLRKSNTLFPLTMPFMPQSNNEFIGYDFYKDRKIPIRFSITNNKAKNIIFETPEGEITAQLIPF